MFFQLFFLGLPCLSSLQTLPDFYHRWQEAKARETENMGFHLTEQQWQSEWEQHVDAARQPKTALSNVHIFVLVGCLLSPIGYTLFVTRGTSHAYVNYSGPHAPASHYCLQRGRL